MIKPLFGKDLSILKKDNLLICLHHLYFHLQEFPLPFKKHLFTIQKLFILGIIVNSSRVFKLKKTNIFYCQNNFLVNNKDLLKP